MNSHCIIVVTVTRLWDYYCLAKCIPIVRIYSQSSTIGMQLAVTNYFAGRIMRLFIIVLLGLLAWLQYDFWYGKNGMNEYTAVEESVALQEKANAELHQRNQQMYAEIKDLHGGKEAVEERARTDLGLVKPGETFVRVVGDNN